MKRYLKLPWGCWLDTRTFSCVAGGACLGGVLPALSGAPLCWGPLGMAVLYGSVGLAALVFAVLVGTVQKGRR